ncbi:MAG: hypothetical protein HOJ64_02865 [Euryarchaeota archaeon]|jgi:uncharacterized coiled-coil DUF342 family protein|nr:hypothetical protein [Euryarchaeota archaeon]MBT4392317.1 hypothetical protein [Euryarchaeota archaeon]MBT4802703.1 hypothetical protein [Euryarchaeota archaeon]MBT5613793.1 hypothetical protein [Euryarchaeota archaeon]MBT6683629.1 hypothetical protein [Euryarchaeota archaeon]
MNDVAEKPEDDLRSRLHAMETKLKRMRDQRNNFSENARRAADSRNGIQEQSKELRDKIKQLLEQQKEIRLIAKGHQMKRDEIQNQIRELISKKKGRKDDNKGTKSVIIQLSETVGAIERIERQIMTDGTITLKKENSLLKKLKVLISKRAELSPLVEDFNLLSIDLGDMEGSIQLLKVEADSEHKLMIDAHSHADEVWDEIKPMFEERDFMKAEGDRLHESFVLARKNADEVHASIVELLKKVNEIRDEMKAEIEEGRLVIENHNKSVRESLTTPDMDEDLANSLSAQLMETGSLTFGGTLGGDFIENNIPKSKNKKQSRKLGTSRGRKK